MAFTWTPRLRLGMTISAAFLLALLSGQIMQSNWSNPPIEVLSQPPVVIPSSPVVTARLQIPPSLGDRILETRAERGVSCAPSLELSETPGGLLDVAIQAACHRAELIDVTVNELTATVRTDAHGQHTFRLPALAETVAVTVSLGAHILTEKLSLSQNVELQHVILAWKGGQIFSVRTTTYATAADAGRTIPVLQTAPVGVLTQLGSERGHAFEILSFPARPPGAQGVIRLTVEAEVTEANCGQDVSTLAYQTGYSGKLRPTEIDYTMPGCDRVGDIVRLQNLFRDMRLAAR